MRYLFARSLLPVGAFLAAGLFAHAQTPKIAVVDLEKVFMAHSATIAEQAKLKASSEKAQAELDQMTKERDDLVAKYKASLEQANNPLTTGEAKTQAQAATQKIGQEAQAKINDIQKFAGDARMALQQQSQNFRSLLFEEITKVATRVAKDNGATLLFDRSAISADGAPVMLYSDPSYDITPAVQAEIVKNQPAAGPAGAPPAITVPNVTPAK